MAKIKDVAIRLHGENNADGEFEMYFLNEKPVGEAYRGFWPDARRCLALPESRQSLSLDEFAEALRSGCTFQPFLGEDGQQVFAIDVDDGAALGPVEALERCEEHGILPELVYFTLSSTPESPRYRLVWVQPSAVKGCVRGQVVKALLALFPEADASCTDEARAFLGSNGEVWPLYRCEEVGA